MTEKKLPLIIYPLISGLLLWAAWPVSPFTFLIFFAFVPLLWLGRLVQRRSRYFFLTAVGMIIWNALTTWWIWNASPEGTVAAVFVNTVLMAFPWLIYHIVVNRSGVAAGTWAWLLAWMSYEYFHLQDWGLSWPWLTLGNVFAGQPSWVQWYEITGSSGGTFWVLLINILVFRLLTTPGKRKTYSIQIAVALLLPILISMVLTPSSDKNYTGGNNSIVVVQPNIDPYKEKFTGSLEMQVHRLIRASEGASDSTTSLVIWPETAIHTDAWEETIAENFFYYPLWDYMHRNPKIHIFSGINGFRRLDPKEKDRLSARRLEGSDIYYEAFNSAALMDADTNVQFYHKSRLVPGVEAVPGWASFLGPLLVELGGISGTYGTQEERSVLSTGDGVYKIAPAICYESIYGEFLTEYIRNGANLIAIITNDGWWGNTAGYKQHMEYARLRAIETRRWIARSANTGISCFIDPFGKVYEPQPWDIETAIRMKVPPQTKMTFFVSYGDLLSKTAAILLPLYLIFLFLSFRKSKKA